MTIWKYKWKCNGSEWQFQGPTYPPTEAIACPHAIYITLTLLILGLWLNFAWYHLITSYFCKVFYLNCNMVGSCVTTIFCCCSHFFIFELCIMIIWLLLQSISLLDCIIVGSCVTTMIVFVSNYPLSTFE